MITLFNSIEIGLKYFTLPIIYVAVGIVVYKILKRIINNVFNGKAFKTKRHYAKRANTLKVLLLNIIKYVIIIFVVLAILTVFGVNIRSILAGLGITAAIIGLAFQDLAKDLIAGAAIIGEDQYEIGDTIEVDGFTGEVVSVGLKTTRIRDFKGRTKIIANHNITEVINYNLSSNLAIVDVGVDYNAKTDKVEKVLNELCTELTNTLENLKGDVELLGITNLDDSAVVYRIVAKTESTKQYEVERKIRKAVKDKLDKEGITIPFPQVEVHNGK